MVKIAVIPGDGIGPEVMREGVRVLEHLNQHSSLGLELVTFDCCVESQNITSSCGSTAVINVDDGKTLVIESNYNYCAIQ